MIGGINQAFVNQLTTVSRNRLFTGRFIATATLAIVHGSAPHLTIAAINRFPFLYIGHI